MSRVISQTDRHAVDETVRALRDGGVVVVPTDTVYGVAALLEEEEAVGRIFEIKKRPHDKPLPVLAASSRDAFGLGRFGEEALGEILTGWPGALTVVVPAITPLPQIGGDGMTVGLRVPDHPFLLRVLEQSGPVAATSANLSGEPEPATVHEIREKLGDDVDLYVDGGRLASRPSRVISFAGSPRVLRG